MNDNEKYILKWSKFEEVARKTFNSLHSDLNFTNVTLVCQDDQQVEAHKVVLSSASSFFHRILIKNPHSHPLIYLTGINLEELKAIVDFIYLGHTEIESWNLEHFLKVANDLEVRGLQTQQESQEQIAQLETNLTMDISDKNAEIDMDTKEDTVDLKNYVMHDPTDNVSEQTSETQYPCGQCVYKASSPNILEKHMFNEHQRLQGYNSKEINREYTPEFTADSSVCNISYENIGKGLSTSR